MLHYVHKCTVCGHAKPMPLELARRRLVKHMIKVKFGGYKVPNKEKAARAAEKRAYMAAIPADALGKRAKVRGQG
jgi:hypothetical protein